MRLGILGGSFDPPHHAHLAMARAALAWGLDQVLLIPARVPPHKQTHALTDPYLRYAMAELAALNEPGLLVDPLELEREGPSYTIDTLRALHGRGDLEECFVLVGEDNWRTLGTWKDLDQFPPLARFMVFEREAAEEPGPAVPETVRQGAVHFPGFAMRVSGTGIRALVAAGDASWMDQVPALVRAYIEKRRLYVDP